MGVDAVQLRRLDQRGDAAPSGGAFVMAREQRILAIQSQGPDEIFNRVAVHLDPAVGEEELESAPVAGDIAELLAEPGLGGNAGALLLHPRVPAARDTTRERLELIHLQLAFSATNPASVEVELVA